MRSSGSGRRTVSASANPSTYVPTPTTPNALDSVKNLGSDEGVDESGKDLIG